VINKPRVIGGIGEKKSNGGRQWYLQDRIYYGDYAIAIATSFNPYYLVGENMDQLRIRKLTPKECWRLMGFDDEDFEKASKENSNAQLYKQAGNSIVVNVLEEIFKQLL
jgi:DNA (cytosine-5)-methyltransferase 1